MPAPVVHDGEIQDCGLPLWHHEHECLVEDRFSAPICTSHKSHSKRLELRLVEDRDTAPICIVTSRTQQLVRSHTPLDRTALPLRHHEHQRLVEGRSLPERGSVCLKMKNLFEDCASHEEKRETGGDCFALEGTSTPVPSPSLVLVRNSCAPYLTTTYGSCFPRICTLGMSLQRCTASNANHSAARENHGMLEACLDHRSSCRVI